MSEFSPGQSLRVVSEPRMHEKRKSPWKVGDVVVLKAVRPSGLCVEIIGVSGFFRIERFAPA